MLIPDAYRDELLKALKFCKRETSHTVDDTAPSAGSIDNMINLVEDRRSDDEKARHARIRAMVETNDELEVEDDAVVSEGADPGAWVQSWSWVSFDDLDDEEEPAIPE